MPGLRLVGGDAGYLVGAKALTIVSGLATAAVIARTAPSYLGLVIFVQAIVAILSNLGRLGSGRALIAGLPVAKPDAGGLVGAAYLISACGLTVIGAMSGLLLMAFDIFGGHLTAWGATALGALTFLEGMRMLECDALRASMRAREAAMVEIYRAVGAPLALALLSAMVRAPDGTAVLVTLVAASAVAAVVGARHVHGHRLVRAPSRRHLAYCMQRGKHMLLADSASLVTTHGDIVSIGIVGEGSDADIYGASSRLVNVMALPLVAINGALAPAYAHLWARRSRIERSGLQPLVSLGSLAGFIPIAGLGCAAFVLAPALLEALYSGAAYSDGALYVRILIVGQVVNAACGPCYVLLSAAGHEARAARLAVHVAVVAAPTILGSSAFFGALGAAVATSCSIALSNSAAALLVWKTLKVRTFVTVPTIELIRSGLEAYSEASRAALAPADVSRARYSKAVGSEFK